MGTRRGETGNLRDIFADGSFVTRMFGRCLTACVADVICRRLVARGPTWHRDELGREQQNRECGDRAHGGRHSLQYKAFAASN